MSKRIGNIAVICEEPVRTGTRMNRRAFLTNAAAMLAGATLDPERLLWVPGAKVYSIPKPVLAAWTIHWPRFYPAVWPPTVFNGSDAYVSLLETAIDRNIFPSGNQYSAVIDRRNRVMTVSFQSGYESGYQERDDQYAQADPSYWYTAHKDPLTGVVVRRRVHAQAAESPASAGSGSA